MSATTGDILREEIARNAGATLSLPSAGMMRCHPSRFLAESETGVFMESPIVERALVDQLIAEQSAISVTFKAANDKITFASPIHLREEQYRVNDQTVVEALLLRFPDDMKPVQRRAHYRVVLAEEQKLNIRMWRIADHVILRDRPIAAEEFLLKVKNFSVGGMGFEATPKISKPLRLANNERMRIILNFNNAETLVEGRVRHIRNVNGKLQIGGLQFKKLEHDLEGRQTLSKLTAIVGHLQREEIRRRRAP